MKLNLNIKKKYMLYVYGVDSENNMTVECADAEDLAHYASAAIMQDGYREVVAKIEDK